MLSKACVYSLRAVIFVAKNTNKGTKLGVKEIAERLELPAPYLGKILQQLAKHKIIQSVKGPRGGFYIDDDAQQIKVIKIIEIIDDLSFFNKCGLGLKACSEKHPCPLHKDFKAYRDGLFKLFSDKSIADLVAKIEDGEAFIRNLNQIIEDD